MLCVAGPGIALALSAAGFTLEWSHSTARSPWWERWQVTEAGLAPVEARIAATGAGMEPPPDAVLRDGAWWYRPELAPMAEIRLAASGSTGGGWRLCTEAGCHDLPEKPGHTLRLWSARDCAH